MFFCMRVEIPHDVDLVAEYTDKAANDAPAMSSQLL
jgi:hypothetical protein